MSELLTTGDIARRYEISTRTAYRMMLEIHKKHGARAVARRGRRLVTTETAIAAFFPARAVAPSERRMASVERRLDEADRRVDALAREVTATLAKVREEQREFRKYAAEWFRKHGGISKTP